MRRGFTRTLLLSDDGRAARAQVFALVQFGSVSWASLYLALTVVSGHTYLRSIAFGVAAALSLWLILGAKFSDAEPIPLPSRSLLSALTFWTVWAGASCLWSAYPAYSRSEFVTEVVWGMCTLAVFYTCTRSDVYFRAVYGVAAAAAVALSCLVIWYAARGVSSLTEQLTVKHGGVGAFSTYLAMTIPLLPLILLRKPLGYGLSKTTIAVFTTALVICLVAAKLNENRMFWGAMLVAMGVSALVSIVRWRLLGRRFYVRIAAMLALAAFAACSLFIDALSNRARTPTISETAVMSAVADDPRLGLWQLVLDRGLERPWIGHGFGKTILADELSTRLRNPMLTHPHNIFLSQWIQLGVIGALAFACLLALIGRQMIVAVFRQDNALATVGVVGLAILCSFIAKNITDDFMIRPNSKEFWALMGAFMGYVARRTACDRDR